MRFETIGEGFVVQCDPAAPAGVAVGSRCVVGAGGELICSYMRQTAMGVNDFVPMLARSNDGGRTWSEQGAIWPELGARWSIFCSISRAPSGELFLFGIRVPIDTPGESFWSGATQGLKQNEL